MDFKKESRLILLISIFTVAAIANLGKTISSSRFIPCEEGSYLIGEKCYKIFGKQEGLTWKQASDFCKTRNGSLVSIHTQEFQDLLTAYVKIDTRLSPWIGLNDHQRESVFMWDDGSDKNYTNWDLHEPAKRYFILGLQKDCVEMLIDKMGKWKTIQCKDTRPFICQSNKSEETWSHDSRFCPIEKGGGWRYLNSCYHVVLEEKSWDDAEQYCQENFEGHLLTVFGSTPEEIFLNHVISDVGKDFWIGIKIDDPTKMKWSSGWPVVYKNWSDERRVFANDTCVLKSKEHFWKTTWCFEKRPFICETSSDKPFVVKEGWKCPDLSKDWLDLGGDKCFIFEEKNRLPWYQANYTCAKKGGSLAVLESEEENDVLNNYVIKTIQGMFIGLHRSDANEDLFEWTDGTIMDYQNWYPGEPNDKREKCGELWLQTMQWNDALCNEAHSYICSAKKIPATVIKAERTDVDFSYQDQCNCSGDITLQTAFMVLVGIIILSLLTGLVILNFKTYCAKNGKRFPLKDVDVSESYRNAEDSCELIPNPENSECRL